MMSCPAAKRIGMIMSVRAIFIRVTSGGSTAAEGQSAIKPRRQRQLGTEKKNTIRTRIDVINPSNDIFPSWRSPQVLPSCATSLKLGRELRRGGLLGGAGMKFPPAR